MFRSSVPLRWRRYAERYRLMGNKCKKCGNVHYPKVEICKKCGSKELEEYKLKPYGKLLSFTEIYSPTEEFSAYAPYCVGVIQLEEGPNILGMLADVKKENLSIGMKLRACFRKLYKDGNNGVIHYGIKFMPYS